MDWVFRRYFTRDLYQPHTWWGFDGVRETRDLTSGRTRSDSLSIALAQPYTRMQMEDGSSFIMIMSSVWRARTRPHLCHISYSPLPGVSTKSSASHKTSSETYTASTSNEVEAFLCDFYPDAMDAKRRKRDDSHQHAVAAYTLSAKFPEQDASFTLKVDGGAQSYTHKFTHPETRQKLDLEVRISNNTPHSLLGPMWIGRFLPIPLKWHIFSTRSQTIITIRDREAGGRVLMEKKGLAHQEKNWGIGAWLIASSTFPLGLQGLTHATPRISVCLDLVPGLPDTQHQRLPGHRRRRAHLVPAVLHDSVPLAYLHTKLGFRPSNIDASVRHRPFRLAVQMLKQGRGGRARLHESVPRPEDQHPRQSGSRYVPADERPSTARTHAGILSRDLPGDVRCQAIRKARLVRTVQAR